MIQIIILAVFALSGLTGCLESGGGGGSAQVSPPASDVAQPAPFVPVDPGSGSSTTTTTTQPPSTTTTTLPPAQPYAFGGGQGTQAQPYILQNASDLRHIADFPSAYYWLNNAINMDNEAFSVLPAFSGTLYGNNYDISNLTITTTGSQTAALFASVSGTIVQLKLLSLKSSGQGFATGIAGNLTGTISSCFIGGTITSPSGGNGYNFGTGNSLYVTKSGAASVVNTTQNVQFNGNHVNTPL